MYYQNTCTYACTCTVYVHFIKINGITGVYMYMYDCIHIYMYYSCNWYLYVRMLENIALDPLIISLDPGPLISLEQG